MNNVLALRNKFQMTQDEFADICGLSRISIARYEANGKISMTNAEKIAKACNVSVDFVMGHDKLPDAWTPADYAARGVAVRTQPRLSDLSETDLDILARKLETRIGGGSGNYTPAEQELVDDFRQLSTTQKSRIRAMVAGFLDARELNDD